MKYEELGASYDQRVLEFEARIAADRERFERACEF